MKRIRFVLAAAIAAGVLFSIDAQANQPAEKTSGSAEPVATPAKVDLNTASAAELEKLPGIGTDFANAVIASRPYKSVEDLRKVKGITQETIQSLRDKVLASPVAPPATKTDPSPTSAPSRPAEQLNEGRAAPRRRG